MQVIREHAIAAGQSKTFLTKKDNTVGVFLVEGQCSQLTYGVPKKVEVGVMITADQGPILIRSIHEQH